MAVQEVFLSRPRWQVEKGDYIHIARGAVFEPFDVFGEAAVHPLKALHDACCMEGCPKLQEALEDGFPLRRRREPVLQRGEIHRVRRALWAGGDGAGRKGWQHTGGIPGGECHGVMLLCGFGILAVLDGSLLRVILFSRLGRFSDDAVIMDAGFCQVL